MQNTDCCGYIQCTLLPSLHALSYIVYSLTIIVLLACKLFNIPYMEIFFRFIYFISNKISYIIKGHKIEDIFDSANRDQYKEEFPRTFYRLCTNQHLDDLRWIASFALLAFLWSTLFILEHFIGQNSAEHAPKIASVVGSASSTPDHGSIHEIPKLASAVLSASVAVLVWTYLAGSQRLGAIDLFGSEIAQICHACLVTDFATNSVAMATCQNKNFLDYEKLFSEERYTSFYDEKVSELKPFDYDVITSVNEFYLYRRITTD
jgi:hypothetical protein